MKSFSELFLSCKQSKAFFYTALTLSILFLIFSIVQAVRGGNGIGMGIGIAVGVFALLFSMTLLGSYVIGVAYTYENGDDKAWGAFACLLISMLIGLGVGVYMKLTAEDGDEGVAEATDDS